MKLLCTDAQERIHTHCVCKRENLYVYSGSCSSKETDITLTSTIKGAVKLITVKLDRRVIAARRMRESCMY